MNILTQAPTVEYCEKGGKYLIKRPGYALSNLAYYAAAFFILRKSKTNLAKLFAACSVIIGTFSLFYDVFNNYISQLFDLGGMYVFAGLLLYLNIFALTKLKFRKFLIGYLIALVVLFYSIITIGGHMGQFVFAGLIFIIIFLEIYLLLTKKRDCKKYFISSLLILAFGFPIWYLDASQKWCDPTNLFNGRGIWHYATALVIYLLFLHYSSQKCYLELE